MMKSWLLPALAGLVSLSACAAEPAATAKPPAPAAKANVATASGAKPARAPGAIDASLPLARVHKDPNCGCCTLWVDHLRKHGFRAEVVETSDLEPIRKRLGVPLGKGSCHTAEIGRYVVEGHVPAEDIKRLIAMRDDSRGLVLPGMPLGSPGMEMPDGRVQPYTVERVDAAGATHPFASHK